MALTKKQFHWYITAPVIILMLIVLCLAGKWTYYINKEGVALRQQGGYYTVDGWVELSSDK